MKKTLQKEDDVKIESITISGGFKVLHVKSKPQRLEARVVFDRDDISQKLMFTLMEITHNHGFGCSDPSFDGPEDPSMTFNIGTILPSPRSINKYIERMYKCLIDIRDFAISFSKQLDFSKLDVSMFRDTEISEFYPEHMAAIRDQHYRGSWEEFYDAMVSQKKDEEANVILCCMKFEKINNKDMGLIGHKLGYTLHALDQHQLYMDEVN
ncbi:MAG: hypothetical protein ACXACY_10385 [Candidatus Hodarchaeales archaeon]|jgi:hypothetical protein